MKSATRCPHVREITPALALRATETAEPESKLGIQIGEPVGETKPPRVYLSYLQSPNAGSTGVVTKIMEASGTAEAWEIPASDSEQEEQLADKAAECVQEFLDGFSPEDGGTLFLAGDEEMTDDIIDRIEISEDITIKINEGEPEYIPGPTS